LQGLFTEVESLSFPVLSVANFFGEMANLLQNTLNPSGSSRTFVEGWQKRRGGHDAKDWKVWTKESHGLYKFGAFALNENVARR